MLQSFVIPFYQSSVVWKHACGWDKSPVVIGFRTILGPSLSLSIDGSVGGGDGGFQSSLPRI